MLAVCLDDKVESRLPPLRGVVSFLSEGEGVSEASRVGNDAKMCTAAKRKQC